MHLKTKDTQSSKQYIYVYVILAALANFVIELFSQGGFEQAWGYLTGRPFNFIYNTALIGLTLVIVFLFKRRVFATLVVLSVWMILGAVNGMILSYRVTPFTYLDISLLKNSLTLIDSYLSTFQIVLVCVFLVLLIAGIVVLFIFGPKHKAKINYKKTLIFIGSYIAVFAIGTAAALHFNILAVQFGNIAYAYLDYGFPYCFTSTALNTGVSRPINYNKQSVDSLGVDKDPVQEGEMKTPNIIMIQLESFFDITHVKDFSFSEDPVPVFRSLKENYSSGYLTVPSVSAGTANTEFEVLTGMSLKFFGTGEYPYKTVLKKKTCESIGYNLKDLGYATHAIHNNDATFYSRNKVFKKLGFDSFTAMEFMNIKEHTPNGWSKDKYLSDEIMRTLNSTEEKDFVYTISVQGHGSYPNEKIDDTQEITVDGVEGARKAQIEYYTNQIHEMDAFVGELIEKLEENGEETVLILYGDHLPGLQFENSDLDNYDIYQTEYVMWDNIGLEKQDKNLTSYQLSARVTDLLNIHHGTLMNYHQQYQSTFNYQKNLKLLQYDMLYGKQYVYGQTNPFEATKMRYDVEDILIKNAYNYNTRAIITGDAFTPHCRVEINGHEVETEYFNRNMLRLEDKRLKDGDEIQVMVFTDSGKAVLARSEVYVYKEKEYGGNVSPASSGSDKD